MVKATTVQKIYALCAQEPKLISLSVLKLTGINDLPLYTLGQVKINIFGYPTIFNIILNEVPVEENGLLGSKFFQDNSVNINYTSKCLEIENHCYSFKSTNTFTISARTVTTFYVNIKNTEKREGYVPRLRIQDGVYVGDAVVKNHRGKAYLKFANTNEIPITLSVPIINLEDYEEQECYKQIKNLNNYKQTNNEDLSSKILNNFLRIDNSLINWCKIYNVTDEDRVECIKKRLRLDHLNQDEYEHVEKLIKNNSDRFQIPGEPLEATNVLQHSIPTVDYAPIFSRQYRFPPVHEEEITRQVDELLKNKIKPSKSPYNTQVWIVPKKPVSQGKIKWRMVLDFR